MNAPPNPVRVPGYELADDLVRLRAWRLDDIACIEATSQDAGLSRSTTLPTEFTIANGEAYIRRQWKRMINGEGLSLAIARRDTDEAVGSIVSMLRPQRGVTGIGYWIVPEARRRGYAGAAVGLVTEWTIRHSDLHRIEGWVHPENHASQRVLAGAGYELEGVLRAFLPLGDGRQDMQVWSRIRN